jgi:hypothetical protein
LPATSLAGEKGLLCTECLMAEHLGVIPHTESCKVGAVLGGLKALMSAVGDGCAGEKIRSRGYYGEPWRVEEHGTFVCCATKKTTSS